MIYTNLDKYVIKNNKIKSYKKLGEKFVDWIENSTIKLYKGRTSSESKADLILRKLNLNFEPQCFFYDSKSNKSYFLDFLIMDYNIALEVDGGYHLLNKEYDKQRDLFFSNIGIKTIRINNEKVTYSYIKSELEKALSKTNKCNKSEIKDFNNILKMVNEYNKKHKNKIKVTKI